MIVEGYTDQSDCGVLARLFSSRAVAQILDFFLDHKEFDYSANEISQKTGLSFRTIFREIPDLERIQLIYSSRRIGKTNMYKLNTDLNAVLLLEKFVLELSQVRPFIEKPVDSDDLINQKNTQNANTML
ncbi:MAG: HTH domain-containing protein [Nitrososphaeraceae archaeon]